MARYLITKTRFWHGRRLRPGTYIDLPADVKAPADMVPVADTEGPQAKPGRVIGRGGKSRDLPADVKAPE